MTEIRVAWSPGEARIAVLRDETLIDFALWRPGRPDGLGDVHIVRVTSREVAMGGSFVMLGDGRDGFLTGDHQKGACMAARIVRSPQGGKGLRLKPVRDAGIVADTPRLVRAGPTSLEDLAERYPDAPLLIDSPALSARLSTNLRGRARRVPLTFDAALEAEVDALALRDVELASGLRATITPTPALTAIDMDDPSPAQRPQTAQFEANCKAFDTLATAIRLRNLSGAIVIDPASVSTRKRPALAGFLGKALASDPLRPQVLGATALGLLEVVRTRTRPPLHELLSSPHGIGLAALRRILRDRMASTRHESLTLHASIAVIRMLEEDSVALPAFADSYGSPLTLTMAPDYPDSYWTVSS